MITTSTTTDTTSYTLTVDGQQVATLTLWTATRGIANIETATGHQRRGYARQPWDAANADGECFHALPHHRTDEGDAFAHAVGGDTLDPEDDYIAECCICTGDL